MKMVTVDKSADMKSGINDTPLSINIVEYIRNGIGINNMNKTAKNTPTAYDLF